MRVLLVCHRFPYPPSRGGKIRPFNIIRHWHEQGHEVHVASLTRSPAETAAITGITEYCTSHRAEQVTPLGAWTRMLLRAPVPTPSSMGYFYSRRLARHIGDLLELHKFDLVFVHCSSVAQFVAKVRGIPKILDFGDMDSQKWRIYGRVKPFPLSVGYWWEGIKLEREESRLAAQFDLCTCTTRAELDTLDGYAAAKHTGWFPNGVDFGYFSRCNKPYDDNLLTFIGRMDYFPNQQAMFNFCRNVLPRIQIRRPGVRLQIVGAEPSEAVLALANLPGVSVTGSVDDVRPYARNSALTVAPLEIARGTQNKILESMAMGVPVVTSTPASMGVDAIPDEHLLTADTPQQCCDTVLRLLNNPGERERLADAGRARVLSHHNWGSSMGRLDDYVQACLEQFQHNPIGQ